MTQAIAFKNEVDKAARALGRTDGVIVAPTDTTYGVICRLDRTPAIERIYELKGRDRSKPLIILGSDMDTLLPWVTGDLRLATYLAARYWPGPLTIVARAVESVPASILAGGTTVGLRVPRHEALCFLLSKLPRSSAASTSANLSGAGSPSTAQDVQGLSELVDYIMPDCGEHPAGTESTVIDVSTPAPQILREGAISRDELMKAITETGVL